MILHSNISQPYSILNQPLQALSHAQKAIDLCSTLGLESEFSEKLAYRKAKALSMMNTLEKLKEAKEVLKGHEESKDFGVWEL